MRCTVMTCGWLMLLLTLAGAAKSTSHDYDLVTAAANLASLYRVTEQPHRMLDTTSLLCRPPTDVTHDVHTGHMELAFCHVYVNEIGKPTMLAGRGTFPVGTVVVKSKLKSETSPDVELFTAMRKMPDGYDPEHGNWEYALIDGRGHRLLASGKIDSCIHCHSEYQATDFVTRTYLSTSGDRQPSSAPRVE